jgi:MFS family permease
MENGKSKFHYAWIIMIGCWFMNAGALGGVLDAAGVFFAPVCDDLGFGQGELALYLTFYFLATIVAMPVVGAILPKYDIRVVLSVNFALVCVALAACGFYTELWQWYLSGVAFGFFGSFIFVVPAPILIVNWFKKRTGIVLGVTMCFSGVGGAILAPAFAQLIEAFGWRMAYVLAALILAAIVLPWTIGAFRFKPADMGLKPYGWSKEDEEALREQGSGPVVAPGVPFKHAIRSIPFVCMFLFCGLVAYYSGFNSSLPRFAISIGYTPMLGAYVLSAVMVGNIFDKLLMGWLNDRVGVQFTVTIQLIMVLLGFLCFILFPASYPMLLVGAFLFGVQNSLFTISTPLLIRQLFGEREYAKIFTWARMGTGVIGAFGPPTVGYIYDYTGSFAPAFVVGMGIALACFVVVRIAEATKNRLTWEG